jgi:prepilin signal peptidase PulO-like enzyme (type II secretory pathway)
MTYIYMYIYLQNIMHMHTTTTLLLCVLLSTAIGFAYYYISMIYLSTQAQKFSYASIIYFTGAIALSKLFTSLHNNQPTPLIILIRNQILQPPNTLFNEISSGYSIYWIIISCSLLYDIKQKQ